MALKNVNSRMETLLAGEFSLRYLVEILFRRKRVLVVPLILTPLLALLISLVVKLEYVSSTTILLGKDEVLNPLVRYETAVAMTETNRLGSFEKIVYSRPLLEETIRKLGIDKGLKSDLQLEEKVNSLRKDIRLLGLTTDSFQIAGTASDPVMAKNLVETVSQLFIDKSLQGSRREATTAVNLIQQEVDHYRREMEKTEQELERFRRTNMETLGQITTLGGQLNEYRSKALDAELDLKQERLNENLLQARLTGEKPMVVAQALYIQNTPYQKRYQELELQLGSLMSTREKSHPEVLKIQREMDFIKHLLEDEKKKNQASETQEVRSPVYQEVSARLEDSRIKVKVLEQKSAEYQRLLEETRNKLAEVPELEKELERMQGELKVTHEIYDTLRVKLEQARVTCAVEMAQQANRFTIIDPPTVPLKRNKPNRVLFFFGGIAGGVCIGFFLTFLLEFIDPRVLRTGDILRRINLRMVGVEPKLYRYGETEPFHVAVCLRRMFSRPPLEGVLENRGVKTIQSLLAKSGPLIEPIQKGLCAIFGVRRFVLPPDVSPNLVVNAEGIEHSISEKTPEAKSLYDYLESLRSIAVSALETYTDPDPDRLIWMITSARIGEGKTVLTANLGTVMAGALKKPVLLVDANFQMPSLSETLGFSGMPGLAEVIKNRAALDEVLVPLDTPGLTLLPAGAHTEHPDVLYNDPAFRKVLIGLRERFSFTLMEAPEVLASSGTRLLAPHVDGILFLVKLYSAKLKPIENAIHMLPPEKIIGVVFNYFEYWIPDWLYRWV
jgi:polysaccharide chain length determinant protein (PEP-CTERM system associated)